MLCLYRWQIRSSPWSPPWTTSGLGDGDTGPNTGGMGTIAPNPYYTPEVAKACMDLIFLPTVQAMNQEGRPFKGCLYFGLMLTPKGPKVIEYNCRFGDPETQVVLPLLKTDLFEIFQAVQRGASGPPGCGVARRLCRLRGDGQRRISQKIPDRSPDLRAG